MRSRRAAGDPSTVAGLRKKISRIERKIGKLTKKGKHIPFKLAARMARYMARLRKLQKKSAPELSAGAPAVLLLTTTEPPPAPAAERQVAAAPPTAAPSGLTVQRLKTIAGALDRYSRYRPDQPVSRAFRRAEVVEQRDPQKGLRALIRLARRYREEIEDILNRPVTGPEDVQEADAESPPSTTQRTTTTTTTTTTTARPWTPTAPVLSSAPLRLDSIRNIAMALRAPPRTGLDLGIGPRSSRSRQRAAAAARFRARTATPPPTTTASPPPTTTTETAVLETPPEAALSSADRALVEQARRFSARQPAAQLSQVFRAALDAGSLKAFLRQYRGVIALIGSDETSRNTAAEELDGDEESEETEDEDEQSLPTDRLPRRPVRAPSRQPTMPAPSEGEDEDEMFVTEGVEEPVALPLVAPFFESGDGRADRDGPQVNMTSDS